MTAGLQLGRPGIYPVSVREPEVLSEVRLDVAGFVGVALRGPVNAPTPVVGWADYQSRFGGLEPSASGRDRLLPYAVQAFFAQGGRRAVIVRVAPPDRAGEPSVEDATATFTLGPATGAGPLLLGAADEGAWGSGLSITLAFAVTRTVTAVLPAADRLRLPTRGAVPDASLVRVRYAGAPLGVLRWARLLDDPAERGRLMGLDEPVPGGREQNRQAPSRATIEVVTGSLTVVDAGTGRREQISGLGLDEQHPRYPSKVLELESLLARVVGDGRPRLRPDPLLGRWVATLRHPGLDRSDAVDRDSFFDPGPADADLLDEGPPHRGVDLIGRVGEIGILCVPDLTWRAGARRVSSPERPWLDGTDDTDLAEIIERQQRLVQVADLRRRFVALLDVPTGLPTARTTDWRAAFDSSFAAAYHPWLGVPRPGDVRRPAVLVPPSAFAAGIMADRERRLGLSRGPANQLALGAVRAADLVGDAMADQLHLLAVNVFAPERDGFRLGAARTLSSDPDYRQLSVRRLMTMLALTLQRHGEVLVFEPNTGALRGRLGNAVTELLRGLHRRGAFSGRTEEESFFVRCDDATNPPRSQALGRLVAEIGVAPAAPLEYLVLRVAADGEGGLLVEEQARTGARASRAGDEVRGV